jgi:hypothetical protein
VYEEQILAEEKTIFPMLGNFGDSVAWGLFRKN